MKNAPTQVFIKYSQLLKQATHQQGNKSISERPSIQQSRLRKNYKH